MNLARKLRSMLSLWVNMPSVKHRVPVSAVTASDVASDDKLVVATDCIWDYGSHRSYDFTLPPASLGFRRFGLRRPGLGFGFSRHGCFSRSEASSEK